MSSSAHYVMSSSAALPLLLVALGCCASPPSRSSDVPTKPSSDRAGELAERTLREDAPFDLAFPEQTPPRRHAATAALVIACRAGHRPSCWLLLQMATSDDALRFAALEVIAQCRKGDLQSCQAIPSLGSHPLVPAGLPGEQGRLLFGKPRVTEEEADQLRGECRDGFAYSCKVLAEASRDLAERREMLRKTALAARDGCRRKNPEACLLVEPEWPPEERLAALEWNCVVRRFRCNRLGAALLALGRSDEARSEYERACQYGMSADLCLDLAELYREGKLTEPVKDRGKTILRLACKTLEADGNAGDYDECASSR